MANSGETWLEQQWETARLQLKSTEAPEFIIAIDEIQKIGNWSEVVKKLWDEDTPHQTEHQSNPARFFAVAFTTGIDGITRGKI